MGESLAHADLNSGANVVRITKVEQRHQVKLLTLSNVRPEPKPAVSYCTARQKKFEPEFWTKSERKLTVWLAIPAP